jgi:hypothetical protein
MNFYYDPILGLQYDCLGDYFSIDLDALPQFDTEKWMEYLKDIKIQLYDTVCSTPVEKILKITDYKL